MVLVQERHLATGGAIIVAVQEASVALGVVASTGIAGNSSIGDLGASLTALTAVSGGLRNLIGTTKTSARLTAVLEASLAGTLANTVGANGVEKVGQRSAIVLAISASFGTGSIGLATGERIIVAIGETREATNLALATHASSGSGVNVRKSGAVVAARAAVSKRAVSGSLTTKSVRAIVKEIVTGVGANRG